MKHLAYSAICACALTLTGCHNLDSEPNTAAGNLRALWTAVDEHYCYFNEKNIDWDSVYSVYAGRVSSSTTATELFDICSDMLAELKDGHVNLACPWEVSYYRGWWSDYPQNYDARVIQEYYFNFKYHTAGALDYGILTADSIGYIHYSTFSSAIPEHTLDYIMLSMKNCPGLIIDVRDNGGGDLTNVERLVSRFLDTPITAGYIIHKTGKGHSDFSTPYSFTYSPATDHVRWLRPVVVLTNRSTYSAANNFAAIMRTLPQVTQLGATTGGGGGMPFSSELPCGWAVRMSGSPILDPNGESTEKGVTPHIAVDITPYDTAMGRDPILDTALEVIAGSIDNKSR